MKPSSPAFSIFGAVWLLAAGLHAGQATVTISADQPGHRVSPSLWGIFYE